MAGQCINGGFYNRGGGAASAGAAETLAETLAKGNVTGGNDIQISSGDALTAPAGVDLRIVAPSGQVTDHVGALRIREPSEGANDFVEILHNGTDTRIDGFFGNTVLTAPGGLAYSLVATGLNARVTANTLQMRGTADTGSSAFTVAMDTGQTGLSGDGANAVYELASGGAVSWSNSATDSLTTKDTGLARDAAGVLRVTDGSTGIGALLTTKVVEAHTGDDTLTDVESFSIHTNEGAAGLVTLTLPTAVAGLTFTFYIQAAQTLTITAASGDTIRNAGTVSAAAGNISDNTVGNLVKLIAVNATEWITESIVGTWTIT